MTSLGLCLMVSMRLLRAQPDLPADQTVYQLTTQLSEVEKNARDLREYIPG